MLPPCGLKVHPAPRSNPNSGADTSSADTPVSVAPDCSVKPRAARDPRDAHLTAGGLRRCDSGQLPCPWFRTRVRRRLEQRGFF